MDYQNEEIEEVIIDEAVEIAKLVEASGNVD